ncbi:CFC_HP_G0070350.mRNA.1.CDS.1 [Saccharomyces cerevisiae]|nr:CFC_HP_G0070350.mRNA.1.CDS.1 [Saccharomyces cerevisiae]CAI6667532.1 CFC_HP_G0070350.mRNA.1.CDS.1 [Saccharomyces cerevisiae]
MAKFNGIDYHFVQFILFSSTGKLKKSIKLIKLSISACSVLCTLYQYELKSATEAKLIDLILLKDENKELNGKVEQILNEAMNYDQLDIKRMEKKKDPLMNSLRS